MSNVSPGALAIAAQLTQYYEHCVLHAYLDARGVPTIGWGNTQYENGQRVTMTDPALSQAEADALYNVFLNRFALGVADHMPPGSLDNEVGAFISLAYNIGLGAFTGSTALREYLKKHKELAGNGIEMWNKAGNMILKGLQRRRRAERYVFDGRLVLNATHQAELDFP